MATNTTLQLSFDEIPLFLNTSVKLLGFKNCFYGIEGNTLYNLRYLNGKWEVRLKISLEYNSNHLLHIFPITKSSDILVATKLPDLNLYLFDYDKLIYKQPETKLINDDSPREDVKLFFGNFYSDTTRMGILIIYPDSKFNFLEILERNGNFIVVSANIGIEILERICKDYKTFQISYVRKDPKQMLICRNTVDLSVFEFDGEDVVKFVMKIPIGNDEEDNLYFANISGKEDWMDIITFNSSGMFLFRYQGESFKLIDYNPAFSATNGWTDRHTKSIQFEDVDENGLDDIIFTGPGGLEMLSYDYNTNRWRSLLNTEDLTARWRHSTVMLVVLKTENGNPNPVLLSRHSRNIHLSNIIPREAEIVDLTPPINTKFVPTPNELFPIVLRPKKEPIEIQRSTIYLRDQNIRFDYKNSVNPRTGKPNFVLPLLGDTESTIKFHLYYDGNNDESTQLGVGWSMPQNFIALNYQDGNFEEDESYVLVLESVPHKLKWLPLNSTETTQIFDLEIANDDNRGENQIDHFKAKYTTINSTWEIVFGPDHIQLYGTFESDTKGAVLTDSSWQHWRGLGTDSEDSIERVNIWYLASDEREEITTNYEYDVNRKIIEGTTFAYNEGVFLKRIDNGLNQIQFTYSNQANASSFPLTSYTFETKTKEQTVLLEYSTVGKSLLLTTVKQKSDYIDQPVLQFKYSKHFRGKQLLMGIKLSAGTIIVYKYNTFGKPLAMIAQRNVSVSDDYNVSYGDGFTLVSYVDKLVNRIVLRVFNKEFTEELFPFGKGSNQAWPKLGRQYTVEGHEILLGDNFLTVVIYSSPWKSACSFGRLDNGQWSAPAICYEYREETNILKGDNFILVSEPRSDVKLIEWLRNENKWIRPLNVPTSSTNYRSIAVDGGKFVIYDDVIITLGYRDANQVWTFSKLIRIPGYMEATNDVLLKFNLNEKFQKAIQGFFQNNAIIFRHNLIALSGLRIFKNQFFTTNIRTYVVGRDHRVAIQSNTIVIQDKISEIVSDEETNSEGDKFTLTYALINNIFRIELENFQSPTGKLETRFAERIDSEMNLPTAQRFLLNLKNYFVSFRGQTVMCRNAKFVFGGKYWHRSESNLNEVSQNSVSILLGNRFLVNQTDSESTFKLYNSSSNELITDFEVKNANELQIHYPIYIAWQKKGGAVGVLEFRDDDQRSYIMSTLPRIMELSPLGNPIYIVTSQTDSGGNKTIFFWPIFGIRRYLPNSLISSVKIKISKQSAGSRQRVTGYEYDEKSIQLFGNKIYYQNVSILPGNKKSEFGYFTIYGKTADVFNGEGKFIKRIQNERRSKNQTQERFNQKHLQQNDDATLYDESGRFEIAKYAPYPIASNMSGFIGFEDYERQIENWIYERKNVIRDEFTLTGKNFVRLDNESLKGIFTPIYQDRQFVASCWIRPAPSEHSPKLGDVVPHLRAIVITADGGNEVFNALGDVKLQMDSWLYLEVFVDLEFTNLVLTLANQSQSNNLGIEIWISSVKHFPMDVDSVRFSSLENVFDANVYDEESGKPVAIIKSSGAIERLIYDKYGVQVAEINESNQISEFITYTKGSYLIEKFGNPACLIKINPQSGFYDNFSPNAESKNWRLPNSYFLNTSPSKWQHHTAHRGEMLLTTEDIDPNSCGIRFLYSLHYSTFFVVFDAAKIQRIGEQSFVFVGDDESNKMVVPNEGEFLLIREGPRIMVWIDGGLYVDRHSTFSTLLKIQFEGAVVFQQMMLFSRPKVQVVYKNSLNEEIQEILLSSADTAIVKELLYDELGRQRLTVTPTEISRCANESIISYVADFVTNDVPGGIDSVWKSGQLAGEASNLQGHKFAFNEVVYDSHPLNQKISVGMPGEYFSTRGKFASRFKLTSSNTFLQNRYPPNENFTHLTHLKPSGEERVSVLNSENLKIAEYNHAKGVKDIFSTFEYNDMGLMTKCLTPLYYESFGVFNESTLDLIDVLDGSSKQMETFGIHVSYDMEGNQINKTTPDTGRLEFLYDNKNKMRFMIQYLRELSNVKESIVYFIYDTLGRLMSTGSLTSVDHDKDQLMELNISDENSLEYQHFYPSDLERDPVLRQNILRTITINRYSAYHEESILNVKGEVISKRNIIPNGSDQPTIMSIDKRYQGGNLKEIIYPASMFGELFRVTYDYDILGRMVAIGSPGQANRYVTMAYNANDQVVAEIFTPLRRNKFVRRYKYNEPGFLIQINDPFLCEEISYTENGYDNNAKGDATVNRVKFTAKWHDLASSDGMGIDQNSFQNEIISQSDSKRCFDELKEQGYVDHRNHQSRVFYPDLNVKLSVACTNGTMERRVKEILGKYGFPEKYGFRFDYTGHMELRKAKYFVGSEEPIAFHMGTFAEKLPSISVWQSQRIWEKLKVNGFIVKDNYGREVPASFISKFFIQDLRSIDPKLVKYARLMKKLIIKKFADKASNISFSGIMEQWLPKSIQADLVLQALTHKGYLKDPLQPQFRNILKDFHGIIPDIVGVMHNYSSIGRSEFDVESIDIDLNGNRLQFYEGFDEYRLKYEAKCNRVSNITLSTFSENNSQKVFKMRHDSRGNVIQAQHKGIKFIRYHTVSNRVEEVEMENGNNIKFDYNSKGERVRKLVINSDGQKTSEKEYLMGEHGRPLVERQSTYMGKMRTPNTIVTMYIYGPKFLVGFVRHDQFYSVIMDHQNSVRLIVCDGEVVSAYDYFPYGNLMRIYGRNPNAHIPYRYTGQEWDPELGLYNFRSRFYDPSIGRFYQIDPMMQYFSPYKFSGNSPVSMVDHTGEFAFMALALTTVAFAFLGAYLAGAQINDNLNPFKWEWSNRETQLAIFYGGIGGAFMPLGLTTSIIALGGISITSVSLVISAGLATAYMSVAASEKDLNAANWDYVSPKTWSAAFEGFSMGVGIFGGWHEAGKQFLSLSRRAKYMFGAGVTTFGTSSFVFGGLENDWDVEKPQFWYNSLASIASAPDVAVYAKHAIKFARKHGNDMLSSLHDVEHYLLEAIYRSRQKNSALIDHLIHDAANGKILVHNLRKVGRKLAFGSIGSSLMWTSTAFLLNGDFESWSFSDFTTYHNLLASFQLTGKIFEITTTLRMKPRYQIWSKPLIRMFERTIRAFAGAVAETRSRKFRYVWVHKIPLHPRMHRAISSSTSSVEVGKMTLSINFPNISLVYIANSYINPFFIVSDNLRQDNSTLTQEIAKAMVDVRGLLEYHNRRNFLNENIENWLTEDNSLRTLLDETIIRKCAEALKKAFESYNALISRDLMTLTFHNLRLDFPQISVIKQKYIRKAKKLFELEQMLKQTNLGYRIRNSFLLGRHFLKTAMNNLEIEESSLLNTTINKISEIFWKKLESFRDLLCSWEFDNFAEPSEKMLSISETAQSTKYIPNPNAYDSKQSFRSLSSCKLKDKPRLMTFDNCQNCIKATPKVGDTVRDVTWMTLLNAKFLTGNHGPTPRRRKRSTPSSGGEHKTTETDGEAFKMASRSFNFFPYMERLSARLSGKPPKSPSCLQSSWNRWSNKTANPPFNLTQFGDELFSQMSRKENVLLAEVLIARCTKTKLYNPSKPLLTPTLMREQVFACEIMELYDRFLLAASKEADIAANRLDTSCSLELYKKLIETAIAKDFERIPNLIIKFSLKTLPTTKGGRVERISNRKQRIFQKFYLHLDMDRELYHILMSCEMLAGESCY